MKMEIKNATSVVVGKEVQFAKLEKRTGEAIAPFLQEYDVVEYLRVKQDTGANCDRGHDT